MEYQRLVTEKGTVTIRVEVRRLLRIKPRGRVTLRVISGKKVERRAPLSLAATFASVRPKRRPLDFKPTRDEAVDEPVQKVIRKMTHSMSFGFCRHFPAQYEP